MTTNTQDRKIKQDADAITRQRRLIAAREDVKPGMGLLEECRILHEIIDPAVLAEEPDSQDTRWLEYAYTNTFQATEKFTQAYVEVYPSLRKKYIDSEPHRCPVNPDFAANEPGVMNALFQARQFADLLGVPYKHFIIALCTELITVGLYKRVPLPNHLYPKTKDKALRHGLRIRDRIIESSSYRAFDETWDRRLLAVNYRNEPPQARAEEAMREFVRMNVVPVGALRSYLMKGFMSVEQAERIFPEPLYRPAIDQFRARAGSAVPAVPAEFPPFRPHCFGLHNPVNPVCAKCPVAVMCERMVGRVQREQIAVTGSANPRAERKRADACERKRNQRARDREKRAAAAALDAVRIADLAGATSAGVVPTQEVPPTPLV